MFKKHLSQFGTLVKCQIKKLKMNSAHFTTIPNLRGPAVVSATRSIEDIHNNIIRRICARMPWDRILTRGGRTQAAESEYI